MPMRGELNPPAMRSGSQQLRSRSAVKGTRGRPRASKPAPSRRTGNPGTSLLSPRSSTY